eukprot:2672632-Lingulodinium_polyedra.AAC.1
MQWNITWGKNTGWSIQVTTRSPRDGTIGTWMCDGSGRPRIRNCANRSRRILLGCDWLPPRDASLAISGSFRPSSCVAAATF